MIQYQSQDIKLANITNYIYHFLRKKYEISKLIMNTDINKTKTNAQQKEDKKARLAAAMRNNLRRRKAPQATKTSESNTQNKKQ